ncbi:heavy metal translocatin [Russula earlei]|uniref:Heavy metal translocatin n=1 Tax=Russula earlei TaxID=71964 RepID=A0ACC0UFD5_9AGAM|nr:heavy metal translocatin [Russula earlei]
MPEHAYTRQVPSPASFVSDSRSEVGPCGHIAQEQLPIQYIVGDCIPNGQGGCQRSIPGLPYSCCSPTCRPTTEPCGQNYSDPRELSCEDACCRPPSLELPALECHQDFQSSTAEDDCRPDFSPRILSACGQACPVGTGATTGNEDHVVASVVEGDCRSNPDDVPSAAGDVCCSDCAPEGVSVRGQVRPIGTEQNVVNEDIAVISTLDVSRGMSGDYYCKGHPKMDRLVSFITDTDGPSHPSTHPHSRLSSRKTQSPKCLSEATFARFFDAACCCLIDWRVRPPQKRHHNHNHHHHPFHSFLGHPYPKSKEKNNSRTPSGPLCHVHEKGCQPMNTVDAAEQGGGRIQTLSLTVYGMDCSSCARKFERALLSLPSVQDVQVNVFTGQASLTYRDGFIIPSDIAKRATKLTGLTCVVVDEVRPGGKYRVLRLKFHTIPLEFPALPPGVVILKTSRVESSVILDVQYDATMIQARNVLDIFVSLGGSFLHPSRSNARAEAARDIIPLFRRTLVSALLCTPVIVFSWAPLQPRPIIYGGVSLFLATCIQFYVGAPFYSAAFYALFMQHVLDMDVLVVFSSTVAYGFSLVAYVMQAAGHGFSMPFFETPTLLLTLITLGKLISTYSRRRAASALDNLGSLQPDLVQRVADDTTVIVTHVDLVQPLDVLRVSSNMLIPTDGVVLRGSTQVDESALTGESIPVNKTPGSPLTAGTRNMSCSIDMEVSRAPAENTLVEFAALVARLQEVRFPVQDLADRAAGLLAPVILALAVIVLVIWIAVGMCVRGEPFVKAGLAALRYMIAVLVVSCPCAVVLCVPMVMVITGAVGIREGLLFKAVTALQQAKNSTVAVFDKTGTLTLGHMSVVEAHISREDTIGIILALVSQDSHPVAHAVARYLRSSYPHISVVPLSGPVKSFLGKGLEITIDDVRVRGGSPIWLGLQAEPHFSRMAREALTMFAVTLHMEVVAFFGLADKPRSSSAAAVELLHRQGIQVHIVSGDMRPVVRALAKRLGIPHDRAIGGCLPEEKVAYVRSLQAAGACVMFVGDGTNDTPALAAADISVAMGTGTDVARSAADVVFLAADLARALAALLRLSRGAVRRVYLNFAWAVIYNLFAVLLAAGAFVQVRIAPEYAALGEMVSVMPVVLIAWSMWLLKS